MDEDLNERFIETITTLLSLKDMFDDIEGKEKKEVMKTLITTSLEKIVFKFEKLYFNRIIQKKSITDLKKKHAIDIHKTYNTLQAFLPFAVAFSLYT